MIHVLLLCLLSLNLYAGIEAIYGDDNRQDVSKVTNPLFIQLASSTAAMINKDNIKQIGKESVISGKSLGEMFRLCPEERFRNQPVAANCSGTLVASDLIMTAGHCYQQLKQECRDLAWVFDYKAAKEGQSSVTVPNSSIYECEKVVLRELDIDNGVDHALVKLKRPVRDRDFAKVRSSGTIALNSPLVLIGYPSGLPVKVADDATVLKLNLNSFVTNVDAFTINSGSGVFHAETGEVEGILSSGQMDYDGKGNCSSTVKYEMNKGNEVVVKLEKVAAFLKSYKSM
jgi:V8-like Glu-specific endopeptidase